MQKIAWIIDSTLGELDSSFLEKNHVYVAPMQVVFGDTTYTEGIDITRSDFFDKLKNTKDFPTSSQPSIGQFVTLYEELKEKGYEKGIAIHLSSELSGTLSASVTAASMAEFDLEAVDSKITSYPMKELLLEGLRLQTDGISHSDIAEHLRKMTDSASAYLIVGNLEQLRRGGRLSGAQFLIGNLLQVKPILTFEAGKLVPKEKVRTSKKAKNRIVELFSEIASKNDGLHACIIHSDLREEAEEFKKELETLYPSIPFSIDELGVAIGVHAGAGTLGVIWIKK